MTPYLFVTQTKIILTYFSIHNFLRKVSIADRLFSKYSNEERVANDNKNQNQNSTTNNLIKNSFMSFKTKLQINYFKYSINLSFQLLL